METHAQRKQRENAIASQPDIKRGLKVVIKRLSKEELQMHGVCIECLSLQ